MAKITLIEPLPRDPNVRRIHVGSKVVAKLTANEVERLGLTVGRRWDRETIARVEHAAVTDAARRKALRMLGKKPVARHELIQALRMRGFADDVSDAVADEMAEQGWLDDEAYARAFIESALRKGPATAPWLAEQLRERGLDGELADRVAAEAEAELPGDAVEVAARRRLETMEDVRPQKAARRLASWLERRGYEEDAIVTTLGRIGLPVELES